MQKAPEIKLFEMAELLVWKIVFAAILIATVHAEWTLTWSDEFSGDANAAPDHCKWGFDLGDKYKGWGNNELEYYTSERTNSALDGAGNLVITARKIEPADPNLNCYYGPCQYTSARLLTKGLFEQQFGKFEARIKVPAGKGIWPAFWLLGNNIDTVSWPACGEIDIMEYRGSRHGTVSGTIHGPGYSGGEGPSASWTLPDESSFADAFHNFTFEWSESQITWKVDDQPYHSQTKDAGSLQGKNWAYDHPFFILLNVAVGGHYDGSPDGTTVFPQKMIVDYVRVYRRT